MNKLKTASLFAGILLSAAPLLQAVSDAEVQALLNRIEQLETRVTQLETIITGGGSIAAGSGAQGSGNFLERFRQNLYRQEMRVLGGWRQPSTWEKIEKGLSEEEVIAILGEPFRKLDSFKTRTDRVLIYKGDVRGDGSEVMGEVRLYRDKVTTVSVPNF